MKYKQEAQIAVVAGLIGSCLTAAGFLALEPSPTHTLKIYRLNNEKPLTFYIHKSEDVNWFNWDGTNRPVISGLSFDIITK